MKIVITGASGFLGKHILNALTKKKNIEIIPVTRKNIPGWYQVNKYSDSPLGDILIHLAENNNRNEVQTLGKSYEAQALNTLDKLLNKGYRKVVYVSSSMLYGDKISYKRNPNDACVINDIYTETKRFSELAVLNFQENIVVRLGNVYGHGMSKNNVISAVLSQIPGKGALKIINSEPIRDFIWAEDAAEGISSLVFNNSNSIKKSIFNIGTGIGTSILSLAELALDIAGESERPVINMSENNGSSSIILDISDTTLNFGWHPKVPLRDGLSRLLARQH